MALIALVARRELADLKKLHGHDYNSEDDQDLIDANAAIEEDSSADDQRSYHEASDCSEIDRTHWIDEVIRMGHWVEIEGLYSLKGGTTKWRER